MRDAASVAAFYLRRQDTNNYYRVQAVFKTDATIVLQFLRAAGGTVTTVGTTTAPGVTHTPANWYWLRARLLGSTTVTAQLRLWADGSAEPSSWGLTSADTTPPANLQGPGSFGVRFDAKSGLNGYFDDLTLRMLDTTAPTAPSGLSARAAGAGRLDLDAVGVQGYNVFRDGVKTNSVPVGSTSYSDTGLVAGVNHS